MSIQRVPDREHYQISSRGVWIPGIYENERTARYAYQFPDDQLQRLQDAVNEREPDWRNRFITMQMLKDERQAMKRAEAT